jgi:hypothetical protein
MLPAPGYYPGAGEQPQESRGPAPRQQRAQLRRGFARLRRRATAAPPVRLARPPGQTGQGMKEKEKAQARPEHHESLSRALGDWPSSSWRERSRQREWLAARKSQDGAISSTSGDQQVGEPRASLGCSALQRRSGCYTLLISQSRREKVEVDGRPSLNRATGVLFVGAARGRQSNAGGHTAATPRTRCSCALACRRGRRRSAAHGPLPRAKLS